MKTKNLHFEFGYTSQIREMDFAKVTYRKEVELEDGDAEESIGTWATASTSRCC